MSTNLKFRTIDANQQQQKGTVYKRKKNPKNPVSQEKPVFTSEPILDKTLSEETPLLTSEPIVNQTVLDDYNNFVKGNPKLLPPSQVFDEISRLWQVINPPPVEYDKLDPIQKKEKENEEANIKEKDKNGSFEQLFNINIDTETSDIWKKFKENPFDTPFNIRLPNNRENNLIYYFTKCLYFTYQQSLYNTTTGLDIASIKDQLDKDLHRTDIFINQIEINKDIWFGDNNKTKIGNVDTFNRMLIEGADKKNTTISLNDINIIDISSIQQIVGFTADTIISYLVGKVIEGKPFLADQGKEKILNINIYPEETNVIWNIQIVLKDRLLASTGLYDSMDDIPNWGTLNLKLTMNINNLSYELEIDFTIETTPQLPSQVSDDDILQPEQIEQSESTIQKYTNKISNMGKGALDYTEDNPTTVATGVGATAIGVTVGTLLATGLFALGGKTKKRNQKKRKNRKTIRKNKLHKTRKTIQKNKQRKTKRTQNRI
jgi:hypothetical protein